MQYEDPNNPHITDPGAIFALLDVLNEKQVRQLADLLHDVRNAGGRGEICVLLHRGSVSSMTVKLSMDAKRTDKNERTT